MICAAIAWGIARAFRLAYVPEYMKVPVLFVVLLAVFVPTSFMPGLVGVMFKQFGLTISAATVFSSINALSLSPALCAILMRPSKQKKFGINLATPVLLVLNRLQSAWRLMDVMGMTKLFTPKPGSC